MTEIDLNNWIGRVQERTDVISNGPAAMLSATLDRPSISVSEGDHLPPLWHWLYFLPCERQSDLGVDGHAKRGNFLPPIELPRRMWAGGKFSFHRPLKIGEKVQRLSRIADISVKDGRTGQLVFVRVRHEISDQNGVAITEDHDIVYRGLPAAGSGVVSVKAAPEDAQFSRSITPDAVLLFRYSALTFNGHRIHYDHDYVTKEEGYPGLIVHGPLIATLLIEQLHREHPLAVITAFEFKALNPLFANDKFEVAGRVDGNTAKLWARGPQGQLAMEATATLA